MATVVVFNGSPRKDGHCARLVREVVRGVEAKGGAATVYDLNAPGIRGCQGCFYCRANPGCAVIDDFTPAYADIKNAAGIVFASPIYFADITGQAKICLDRLFPMVGGSSFQPRWPGKKALSIFAQGDGDSTNFQPAINKLNDVLAMFGWTVVDTLLATDANAPGGALPPTLVQRAFAAGQNLAE